MISGNPIHCTNETWENTNWMWDNPLIKDFDDVICSKDGPVYNKKPLKLILRFIKVPLFFSNLHHQVSCWLQSETEPEFLNNDRFIFRKRLIVARPVVNVFYHMLLITRDEA